MVERIAKRSGNRSCPGEKLLLGCRVAGAVPLVDAVRSHRPPLIMVALEPDLEQGGEAAVGRDVLRRQMAVIIDDRLGGGKLVVQTAGRGRGQEKIVMDEW